MEPNEIVNAAHGFLAVFTAEETTTEVRERELRRALDHLAFAYHFSEAPPDDHEYPSLRESDSDRWKALYDRYSALFPDLGYYNEASDLEENIAVSDVTVGDAIDDLADITLDVEEFLLRWDRTSTNDALWYFRFSFESHWGRHLRSLQLYLHERAY